MLFQVALFPEHFRLCYLGFMKASLPSLGYTCQVQSAYDGVLEYGFTHLFRVLRFPLGESRMLSKKKNKNLGLVNEGFSIHEVTVFFFKSEISCNILQPFVWLVTTGLIQKETWKSAKPASESFSFSYRRILIYKSCAVFQVTAMDLKVRISFSLTRHWNSGKSQIQWDHPPAKPLVFYFNTVSGPTFQNIFKVLVLLAAGVSFFFHHLSWCDCRLQNKAEFFNVVQSKRGLNTRRNYWGYFQEAMDEMLV